MKRFSIRAASIAFVFGMAFVGCTNSTAPELGTVTGKVTLNGEPLPDATVVFQPESGRPSLAQTDSSGDYELMYTRTVRGALPGKHTVAIRTYREDDNGAVITKETLPAIYHEKTTLTATVEPKSNVVDFNLTVDK